MSLPYSAIVPISAVVENPAFVTEKKHMLLAITNTLMPSSVSYLEFAGINAAQSFGAYFGTGTTEYEQVKKYFGYLAKNGNAPEKLVVARWYKEATGASIKGAKVTASTTSILAMDDASFVLSMDGVTSTVTVDFTALENPSASYSQLAEVIQTALQTNYENATCVYSSVTKGFIITSGTTGKISVTGGVSAASTGTDASEILGLANGELSQGVDAETFAQFCDRIYQANTAGYSITTLETLTQLDITPAVEWLQGVNGGQAYNTAVRLVFNIADKETAKTIQSDLTSAGYTGYVICYDKNGEFINILDCAICATIDYTIENGAINFNFQPAAGYNPITTLGSVVDYQQGKTNSALVNELNEAKISYVYSLGFGSQEQVLYGFGLMAGDFGTEDVQVNESALEQNIQLAIINSLVNLNKIKLRGVDAKNLVISLLTTPLNLFRQNGSIAQNGVLSTADKVAIAQATGNASAAEAVEQNGYFIKVYDLTEEDIANNRIRVLICYLVGGVVNQLRIIDRIYGA